MDYEEILAQAEKMKEDYKVFKENHAYTKSRNKIDKYRERIYKLEQQIEKQYNKYLKDVENFPHSYRKTILEPIAKEIMKRMPELTHFEILGSFGLNCNYALWLFTDDDYNKYESTKGIEQCSYITYSLSFYNNTRVATGKYIERYERGTIGELNGGNYETVPITSIEQLIDIMKSKKTEEQSV